jgi:DNA-binding winged helix-turn-helix (wHTH) protein
VALVYEFGPFVFEPAERRLSREGTLVPLKPKIFDLLVALVERHGHLVTKQELLDIVWANTFVEEGNLTYSISTLRKALGDGQHGTRYIETVTTRGYRFVAPVRRVETAIHSEPPTRWWQRRGPRLAFVAGATSTMALATLLAMTGRHGPAVAAPVPAVFSIPLPDALHAVTPPHWPFVSPDGTTLAVLMTEPMGTRQRVWLRPLRAEDGAFLDGCEGAQFLEWSPDSTRLVCSLPKKDLQVLHLADGSQRAFCIACGGAAGKMAWSRRGLLLFHRGGSLFAVVERGRPVLVTAPDRGAGEVERALPQFLPDGEHLTFWVQSDDPQRQGLYLARLDIR